MGMAWGPQGFGLGRANRSLRMEKRKGVPSRGENLHKDQGVWRSMGLEGAVVWGWREGWSGLCYALGVIKLL